MLRLPPVNKPMNRQHSFPSRSDVSNLVTGRLGNRVTHSSKVKRKRKRKRVLHRASSLVLPIRDCNRSALDEEILEEDEDDDAETPRD